MKALLIISVSLALAWGEVVAYGTLSRDEWATPCMLPVE